MLTNIDDDGEPTLEQALEVLHQLAAASAPSSERAAPRKHVSTAEPLPEPHDTTIEWTEWTFRNLLESLPDALVLVNQQGRIVVVNSQTEQLFGYARNELANQPIEILVPEALRERHVVYREAYFDQSRVRAMGEGALYGRRKDGSQIPVEISLSPLQTETGLHVISTIRDVSEKKRLEARYRTLVEEIPAVFGLARRRYQRAVRQPTDRTDARLHAARVAGKPDPLVHTVA